MKKKSVDYRIHVRTTPEAGRMLEILHAEGIYGRTIGEVAERLVCRELERIFGAGQIKVGPDKP
jgi:hypothetical protein